ncbi:MAG: MFS transporter, partial [Nocardia sp.]|nr:MFS transporter [Nocardia sp.]
YTVVTAPEVGWSSARTVLSFLAVIALFAAFVITEQRVKHPLVRLSILRKVSLVRASLAVVALAGSYFSWQFIVTLYLQDTLEWSPLKLAMALLPVGVLVVASAFFSDKLIDRFGTGPIIAVTLSVMAIGYLLFLRIDTAPGYLTMLLPAILLIGIGWVGFPAINVQATSGIDNDEQGLAAGVLQTSMQVGAAIVLAVTTAIVTSGVHLGNSPQQMLDTYRPGLEFAAGVTIVGALVALTIFLPPMFLPRKPVAEERDEAGKVLEPVG